jgi:predicted acyltransferase
MPTEALPTATATQPVSLAETAPTRKRLVSLDAFRGAAILGMIIVNNPGTWASVYPPLLHAPWHGWTPTDLVFPFFLFIVGVAIVLAYTKRLEKGVDRFDLTKKAARRTIVLFGLGVFMAAFPIFTFTPEFGFRPALDNLRIMGVLQRIALCYFAASVLVLYTRPKVQYYVLVGLLLGYWAVMMLVPVPGYGAGQLDDPVGTLSAFVDRALLGSHLWVGANREWDPEGLLSTLPAIATTLFGVWTGRLLLHESYSHLDKVVRLFARGAVLIIIGYIWHWFFPINKSLWTSSYAVFTAGQAMCGLGLCYWFFDMKGHERIAKPFVIYGVNALTVFVMSGLLAKSLILLKVSDGAGGTASLQSVIFHNVFLPLASPINASLLYALTWVTGWFVVLYIMYRRNIIIKV